MSSVREQILAYVLEAIDAACPDIAQRSRVTAVKKFPAITIRPDSEEVTNHQFGRSDRDFIFTVEVHHAGQNITQVEGGVAPDEAADEYINRAHAAIMADPTAGGLALQVEPVDIDWQDASAENPRILVSCRYRAKYRHEYKDLTKQL